MKKLKINYTKLGDCVSDFLAEIWAKKIVDAFLEGEGDLGVDTSSEIYIMAFRVLVKEGYISSEHMEIQYEGEVLSLDEFGRLTQWPKGFCDYSEDFLLRLIGWNPHGGDTNDQ